MSDKCKADNDGCLTVILIAICLYFVQSGIKTRLDAIEKKIDALSQPAVAEMPE